MVRKHLQGGLPQTGWLRHVKSLNIQYFKSLNGNPLALRCSLIPIQTLQPTCPSSDIADIQQSQLWKQLSPTKKNIFLIQTCIHSSPHQKKIQHVKTNNIPSTPIELQAGLKTTSKMNPPKKMDRQKTSYVIHQDKSTWQQLPCIGLYKPSINLPFGGTVSHAL